MGIIPEIATTDYIMGVIHCMIGQRESAHYPIIVLVTSGASSGLYSVYIHVYILFAAFLNVGRLPAAQELLGDAQVLDYQLSARAMRCMISLHLPVCMSQTPGIDIAAKLEIQQ